MGLDLKNIPTISTDELFGDMLGPNVSLTPVKVATEKVEEPEPVKEEKETEQPVSGRKVPYKRKR